MQRGYSQSRTQREEREAAGRRTLFHLCPIYRLAENRVQTRVMYNICRTEFGSNDDSLRDIIIHVPIPVTDIPANLGILKSSLILARLTYRPTDIGSIRSLVTRLSELHSSFVYSLLLPSASCLGATPTVIAEFCSPAFRRPRPAAHSGLSERKIRSESVCQF